MTTGSYIESIGIKLPEEKVSTQSIIDRMKISPPIKLEKITGIKERHFCSGDENTFSLAVDAAIDCLTYSSIKVHDIEMIIYCSISKFESDLSYYYEPSISTIVKQKIGANGALSFDISNACAGMATGIHIANDFIQRRVVNNCMIVSGEFISNICNNAIQSIETSPSPEFASLTVGDAGAAVILGKTANENGFEVLNLQTFSKYSKLCIGKLSTKYPGAQMFTQMQKLQKVSISESPSFVEQSLREAGLSYSDIDYMIPHQTAKRAIMAGAINFKEYFGSSPKEIIITVELMGNTASTTLFLALYHQLQQKKFRKEDRILLLSFASGLVMGVIVFKLNELVDKYGQ